MLYLSYSTHNYDRQTAATCNICAWVASSPLEGSKSGDSRAARFTDGHKASEPLVPGLGATPQKTLCLLWGSYRNHFLWFIVCEVG